MVLAGPLRGALRKGELLFSHPTLDRWSPGVPSPLAASEDCPGLWLPEASKNQEHFAQKIQCSLKFEISVSNQENIRFPYSRKQTAGPFVESSSEWQ